MADYDENAFRRSDGAGGGDGVFDQVRPPARCSTLAMRDFMRVPWPAASITTAASLSIDL